MLWIPESATRLPGWRRSAHQVPVISCRSLTALAELAQIAKKLCQKDARCRLSAESACARHERCRSVIAEAEAESPAAVRLESEGVDAS